MKKLKVIFLLINLVVTVILVSSCNMDTKIDTLLDPDNPTQITMWHYYADENQYILEEMIKEFNETVGIKKGVVVTPIAQGKIMDLEKAVTDSANGVMNAQQMPNIFSSYIDKAVELEAMGVVENLNEHFSQEEIENYMGPFVESSKSADGKLLILPILKSTEVLYANKTYLDEFLSNNDIDISKLQTWEGISEISEKYHNQKLLSSSANPDSANSFFGYDDLANYIVIGMKQQGVDVIDYDIKGAKLDKKALKKLFDNYFVNITKGNYFEGGRYRTDNIKTGDIVAYAGSSSGANYFPTEIEENGHIKQIDLLALPYPYFESGQKYSVQQGAGVAVYKAEPKEVEASIEFLKWFTSYDQNMKFAVNSGYLPVVAEAYKEGKLDKLLEDMKDKDKKGSNTAQIYAVSISQMRSTKSYASKPFVGSYEIRTTLASTLKEIKNEGLAQIQSGNLDLDYDKYFNMWLEDITSQLSKKKHQLRTY